MKLFVMLVLTSFVGQASAGQMESWLHAPTANINTAKVVAQVPGAQVFEVPASVLTMALERLTDRPIMPLQGYEVDSFSRGHFSCPAATKPYLVRAVYENGGTGGYELQQVDSSLWVSHASLGSATGMHRSALLVCIGFQPSQVFVTSSGAM
jgi:hypothetical protein